MAFIPHALPTLIGSLPLREHKTAQELVFRYTPEIPLWIQLPCYPSERLLSQFSEHLPGIRGEHDKLYFDTSGPEFEKELLHFFEQYLAVTEGGLSLDESIFAFSRKTGRGFEVFLDMARSLRPAPAALKGQITGPFTMLTGLKDQDGRVAYFNAQLREAVVRGIGLKACFQAEKMQMICPDAIIFLDEPALSGFGSSAMVGITRDEVAEDMKAVIEAIHSRNALCGIHVCANTDWSLLLETPVDIISFDAYGYFDRFALFRDRLGDFFHNGGIVAWGIVPTHNIDDISAENVSTLYHRWKKCVKKLGMDPELIVRQSLVTPSCGTGTLPLEMSERVLALTRDLSRKIRGIS